MVIELPPADLAAAKPGDEEPMMLLPVYWAEIPASGAIYRAEVELRDRADNVLPRRLLHHFNLNDPGHRELFLPIGLHILASGRETPTIAVPRILFGMPLERGQRFLMSAMLANPDTTPYSQVRVRLVMHYQPANTLWPLFPGYPWVMDALFPLGHPPNGSKAFDLAPGRSEHSWEANPVVAGTIVGVGGHLHDYGVSIDLTDVTTGRVIWHGLPIKDSSGHVTLMPTKVLASWHSLGVHVVPEHRYRITATYDNPTGEVLQDGGMGLVCGLFIPDRGTHWPAVDAADTLYQQDLLATLQADSTDARTMMHMGHAMPMGGIHMDHMSH